MILLPCDESFAFDYLSILYTKRRRGLDVESEIASLERSLSGQLNVFRDILDSREFAALCRANLATFDAVARAGNTPVQRANYRRFKAKRSLQRRFFPQFHMMEKKRARGV